MSNRSHSTIGLLEEFTVLVAPGTFVILWASGFIGAKLGLPYAEPLTFLLLRMIGAVLLLGVFILHARPKWPDRNGVLDSCVTGVFMHALYLGGVYLSIENGLPAAALFLWTRGKVEIGTVAMALPLAWQIVNIAGWVAWQITSIFENVGVIQEGMMTIARPIALTDRPDAVELKVTRGEIRFENVSFGYGRQKPTRDDGRPFAVLDGLSLTVKPSEKVGLIGRSGAGKSISR